uniref:Uncharacterized protein n=1 Tax=Glossina austeni TaxID=7395 RepID=A0A1A9UN46_GLOAU
METYLKKPIFFLLLSVLYFSHLNRNHTARGYSQYKYTSERYYVALEDTDHVKRGFQALLRSFLENLQKNLSTSTLLNVAANTTDVIEIENRHHKLTDLSSFFQYSSEQAALLADKIELCFEITKNESESYLRKWEEIRWTPPSISTEVKALVDEYFIEMQSFHTIFSEIIDDFLEYIAHVLRSVRDIFIEYADIQTDSFRRFKTIKLCYNLYMDFLQQWSAIIFKCTTATDLNTAYDVYTTSETTSRHVMKQLEFRMQRLHNCLASRDYRIRCQFLRNPEKDLSKLFIKLDELQQYFDIKIKRGRVNSNRKRRSDISEGHKSVGLKFKMQINREHNSTADNENKCIPVDFPYEYMSTNLKKCFDFLLWENK